MDRLRSIPWITPLRAFLLGMGIAALWLSSTDGAWGVFLGEAKRLMSDGRELHAFAMEGIRSFGLISLALVIGLSFALALAVAVQSFGDLIAKILVWLGRLMADVTPIAWAFGVMILLARVLELPILGLLPDSAANQAQNWQEGLGRKVWQWMVPAITLAIPVSGLTFYTLGHQLSEWLHDPALGKLKARGFSRSAILYRHLMPQVSQHLGYLARPALLLLMAFAIPVEKMLGFEGWGRSLADALLQNNTPEIVLSFGLGGVLLALGCLLLRCLEQRSSRLNVAELHEASPSRNKGAFVAGLMLMVSLMMLPKWLPPNPWSHFQRAYDSWWHEVSLALFSSLMAFVAIFFYSFLMGLSRKEPGRKNNRIASLLLFTFLLAGMAGIFYFVKTWNFAGVLIGGVILHGLVTAREMLTEMYASDRLLSARSLGRATYGVWRNHILPNLLPSLLRWAFWNTANVLLIVTLIRFCVPAAASAGSWGQQLQLASDGILESPMPAFAPSLLLALWCLSFRLISRAFPVRTPSLPASPFVTR